MRTTLLAAAAMLALSAAAPAFAGEGQGSPFPFSAPGVTETTGSQFASAGSEAYPNRDVGSEAYPSVAGLPGSDLSVVADGQLSGNGNEASVQTANSLPSGFEVGTAAYAYAQSVNRYFAGQTQRSSNAYAARAAAGPSQN